MPTSSACSPVPIDVASATSLSFKAPGDWGEQIVKIYAPPPGDSASLSLAVTRRPRDPSASLPVFAGRQLASFAQRLASFELLLHEEMIVGGHRAIRARFRAIRGDRARLLDEVIVYVDAPEGDVVTFSCTFGPDGEVQATQAMDQMLSTVRFTPQHDEASGFRLRSSAPPPPEDAPVWAGVPMPGQRRSR